MNLEVFVISSAHETQSGKESRNRSRYIYYSDFSKSSGERQMSPKKLQNIPMTDVEQSMDVFLKEHWSLHDMPDQIWPRIRTIEDPQEKTVLRIEEYPIKVDGICVLSIKKSFRVCGSLKALSYQLATLNNS